MPSTQLNYDIWHKVLELLRHELLHLSSCSYFRHRACRKTILSIALTSTTLADIALSALWWDMCTLQPIVRVVNAFAVDELLLRQRVDVSKGVWVLEEPPNKDVVCDRVWSYLRRIRFFRVKDPNGIERALWKILSQLLDSSTLLPNLGYLSVKCRYSTNYHDFHLLVPPTLDTFQLSQYPGVDNVESILELYQVLAGRRVALRSISYEGDSSPRLFLALSLFKTLRNLSVTHEAEAALWQKWSYELQKNKMSLLELTQKLPELLTLQIDLRTVSLPGHTPIISVDHYSLNELTLDAIPETLPVFLRSGFQCSCLETINIRLRGLHGLSWRVLLNQVASTFPRLEALCIEIPESFVACPHLQIQDLEVFLSRHMTKLWFVHIPYDFLLSDLGTMVKAWPDLRSLTLSGSGVFYDPLTLTAISQQLHHLEHLCIRVDCMALVNLHSCPLVHQPRNTLQEICLVCPTWTSTMEVAKMLARRLRWLFPKLGVVDAEGAVVSDLNHILKRLDCARVVNTRDVASSVE